MEVHSWKNEVTNTVLLETEGCFLPLVWLGVARGLNKRSIRAWDQTESLSQMSNYKVSYFKLHYSEPPRSINKIVLDIRTSNRAVYLTGRNVADTCQVDFPKVGNNSWLRPASSSFASLSPCDSTTYVVVPLPFNSPTAFFSVAVGRVVRLMIHLRILHYKIQPILYPWVYYFQRIGSKWPEVPTVYQDRNHQCSYAYVLYTCDFALQMVESRVLSCSLLRCIDVWTIYTYSRVLLLTCMICRAPLVSQVIWSHNVTWHGRGWVDRWRSMHVCAIMGYILLKIG